MKDVAKYRTVRQQRPVIPRVVQRDVKRVKNRKTHDTKRGRGDLCDEDWEKENEPSHCRDSCDADACSMRESFNLPSDCDILPVLEERAGISGGKFKLRSCGSLCALHQNVLANFRAHCLWANASTLPAGARQGRPRSRGCGMPHEKGVSIESDDMVACKSTHVVLHAFFRTFLLMPAVSSSTSSCSCSVISSSIVCATSTSSGTNDELGHHRRGHTNLMFVKSLSFSTYASKASMFLSTTWPRQSQLMSLTALRR